MTDIKERVIVREPELADKLQLVEEYIITAIDRIVLYAGLESFPDALNSIAVDVVLAMYRRKYHEGISSENVDVMSITFVNGLLSEYDREFSNYKNTLDDDQGNAGKMWFI
ncbi:phage head-tail connector protein [Enterococcus sp. AZ177]|uniref:phage head-tail connector protein n=1 Tax=unclassified Enterococcus TaxID=2608891 RepID=UPI003D2FCB2B